MHRDNENVPKRFETPCLCILEITSFNFVPVTVTRVDQARERKNRVSVLTPRFRIVVDGHPNGLGGTSCEMHSHYGECTEIGLSRTSHFFYQQVTHMIKPQIGRRARGNISTLIAFIN